MPGKPRGPLHPMPTLGWAATRLLATLAQGATVFEFGSGGSTLWFAQRAAGVISIEHDNDWHQAVLDGLARYELAADVRLVEASAMAQAIDDESQFSLVFVDCFGPQRGHAILKGARHVNTGGCLVADDYDFPRVKRAITRLQSANWDVTLVSGVKTHSMRGIPVKTVVAFCRRGEICS